MTIFNFSTKFSIGILTLFFLFCVPSFVFAKKKVTKIVIDAGHGGRDPGCHGLYSYEKDITLAVSKKLGKLIQTELPDTKVVYTREYDWYPELKERNARIRVETGCRGEDARQSRIAGGQGLDGDPGPSRRCRPDTDNRSRSGIRRSHWLARSPR